MFFLANKLWIRYKCKYVSIILKHTQANRYKVISLKESPLGTNEIQKRKYYNHGETKWMTIELYVNDIEHCK